MKRVNCLILLVGIICFPSIVESNVLSTSKQTFEKVEDDKQKALTILEIKCNKCHQKKSRLTLFTSENMDIYATQIKHQIFISKKMPKGRMKLSESELEVIQNWLRIALGND